MNHLKPLAVATLLFVSACASTPTKPTFVPKWKVVWAGEPVLLEDGGKHIRIQFITVSDGMEDTKLFLTGCTVHKGDYLGPECQTATNPRHFDWELDK